MLSLINSLLRGLIIGAIFLIAVYIFAFIAVTDRNVKTSKDLKPLIKDMLNYNEGLNKINIRAVQLLNSANQQSISKHFNSGYQNRANKILNKTDENGASTTIVAGYDKSSIPDAQVKMIDPQKTNDSSEPEVNMQEYNRLKLQVMSLEAEILKLQTQNRNLTIQVQYLNSVANKKK